MRGRSRAQRLRTPDSRISGARGKALGVLTAFTGALKETAVESARDGIKNLSERVGKLAGDGMVVVATAAAAATAGHRSSPMITIGAAYAGMKVGRLAERVINTGLDRIIAGRGASSIGTAMAELATVLQTLDRTGRGVASAIDSVNHAQARVQKVGRGQGNNLLNGAIKACRQAPARLDEGVAEIRQSQDLVGKHLVTVATAGG